MSIDWEALAKAEEDDRVREYERAQREDGHRGDDPTKRDYVIVKDFLKALHDAGLLPQWPNLTRVVIDANIDDGVVRMYVDQIPSGALLTIAPLMPKPEGKT